MKLAVIIGTRPQFIKLAALVPALRQKGLRFFIVRTGQHYDDRLSDAFLREFSLPETKYDLRIRDPEKRARYDAGRLSFGSHVAEVLVGVRELVPILKEERATHVVVIGDSNPAVNGARAAGDLKLPVVHCEAGLRSDDPDAEEEQNRVEIDHYAAMHLCSTERNKARIQREVAGSRPIFTGDLLLDVFRRFRKFTRRPFHWPSLRSNEQVCLLTIHRTENIRNPSRSLRILEHLLRSWGGPVVWPVHPSAERFAVRLRDHLPSSVSRNLYLLDPATYMELNYIRCRTGAVITDSVGLQVESYFWKTPCLVVRDNVEHSELLECGASVSLKPSKIEPERVPTVAEFCVQALRNTRHSSFIGDLFGRYDVGCVMADSISRIDSFSDPGELEARERRASSQIWQLPGDSLGRAANLLGGSWNSLLAQYSPNSIRKER